MPVPDAEDESVPKFPARLMREVTAVAAHAAMMRDVLADWATSWGLTADLVRDLRLAVYEAMANVVAHAYPRHTIGLMTVIATRDESGEVAVTVSDIGCWRKDKDPGRDGGRGIPIIRAVAPQASVTSTGGGTTVRMVWPGPLA